MAHEPLDSAATIADVGGAKSDAATDAAAGAGGVVGAGADSTLTQTRPMDAAEGALFCPRNGVNAGATRRLARETIKVLRKRLAAAAVLMLVGGGLAALRFFFVDPRGVPTTLLLALLGLASLAIVARKRPNESVLKAMVWVLFGAMLLSMAVNTTLLIGSALDAGDLLSYHRQVNRVPGLFVIIMLAFAMLIPTRWQQTLGFVVGCTAVWIGVMTFLALTHREQLAAAGAQIDVVEQASFSVLMLVVGAFISVFGTKAMAAYRRAAAEADDAGMYLLQGKLGEGGMGEVWRAQHRMLARPAAIKIIRPAVLENRRDPGAITGRFEREARATAALQSPHTVQLYDFGVTTDGTFFYVMEFLRGLDLDEMVYRFGPLPPSRAVYLLLQAAESLQEAHARGLVHRDVKPANLHAGQLAGTYDWLKVLDFGLVKSFRQDEQHSTQLTREGVTTGTPAYFPPEMARGANHADERSDIYALAAVGYWLLTAELVFQADAPMEMIVKHVQETPQPPSSRSEVLLDPALDAVILGGLEKKPDERPQSMAEFADLLRRVDTGPAWTAAKAAEWWRLHLPEATGTLVA